uniref:Ovule protein n=1 Tax=Steinernema glaseri TaxID=37863 RepID=A0A1I8AKR3_9BILA
MTPSENDVAGKIKKDGKIQEPSINTTTTEEHHETGEFVYYDCRTEEVNFKIENVKHKTEEKIVSSSSTEEEDPQSPTVDNEEESAIERRRLIYYLPTADGIRTRSIPERPESILHYKTMRHLDENGNSSDESESIHLVGLSIPHLSSDWSVRGIWGPPGINDIPW